MHLHQVFQMMSAPPPSVFFLPRQNNGDGDNTAPSNSVIYIQPTPIGFVSRQHTVTDWKSGLFGCHSDVKTCCKTMFCPCITSSQIVEIVTEGKTTRQQAMVIFGAFCVVNCLWIYTFRYRTIIRSKFNIIGSPWRDCLAHSLCFACALCQEYRELDNRGFDPCLGWFENLERQKYAVAVYAITPPKPLTMERS